MNPKVRDALLREKNRQMANGIKCSVTIDGLSDFVFLDDKGGLFHYKKLNHRLDRISSAIDSEIKSKISGVYRDKYKEAYRNGDDEQIAEIEEILDNTGFDFDTGAWEDQVDEKYGL
jgi:hypothetical protein